MGNMVRLIISLILLGLLTACTTSVLTPPSQLVQKAIALELAHTQQQLNQQLDLDFQSFEINQLSIRQEQPLMIENLPTYRVRGTYDLTFKLPKRKLTQRNKSFEIYLQIQKEGKTWRLLLPDQNNSQLGGRSYLIQ